MKKKFKNIVHKFVNQCHDKPDKHNGMIGVKDIISHSVQCPLIWIQKYIYDFLLHIYLIMLVNFTVYKRHTLRHECLTFNL